jgi:hypothetical protein
MFGDNMVLSEGFGKPLKRLDSNTARENTGTAGVVRKSLSYHDFQRPTTTLQFHESLDN